MSMAMMENEEKKLELSASDKCEISRISLEE
jgi:hypothetical protein